MVSCQLQINMCKEYESKKESGFSITWETRVVKRIEER